MSSRFLSESKRVLLSQRASVNVIMQTSRLSQTQFWTQFSRRNCRSPCQEGSRAAKLRALLLTVTSALLQMEFLVTSGTVKNEEVPSGKTIVCFQRQLSNFGLFTFSIVNYRRRSIVTIVIKSSHALAQMSTILFDSQVVTSSCPSSIY